MGLQALLHLVYPPQCITCGARVTSDFGLCSECWQQTPFITGLVCQTCGIPLPGEDRQEDVHCDDCLIVARPWTAGRAAMPSSRSSPHPAQQVPGAPHQHLAACSCGTANLPQECADSAQIGRVTSQVPTCDQVAVARQFVQAVAL